eukprot:4437321-Heterocapsa_arctica.AAC.1
MASLLRAAGVPADVIEKSWLIVENCSVCRAWARPGLKSVPPPPSTSTTPCKWISCPSASGWSST